MATPITWRTVAGPSVADAARPMAFAQEGILGGFSKLGDAIKSFDAGEQDLFKKQDAAATQDILGKIYQARTVGDFNALNTSGALDQAVAANGARIDRAAVNALRDGRESVLQNREKQGWEFQDATTDRAQLPIVQGILTLAAEGKKDEALRKMAENPNLRLPAPLMDAIVKGDRDFQRWGFTVAEEKQKEILRPLDVQEKKLSISGKQTSNALQSVQLTDAQDSLKDKQDIRRLENRMAAEQENYRTNREAIGRNMGILASQTMYEGKPLPTTVAGLPDFNNMTSEQLDAFDKAAGANKQVTLPKAREYMTGDTKAANDFIASLSASKEFRPGLINKFRDQLRAGFDSNANAGLVGNDAYQRQLGIAQNKVKFDELDASNWYAPGAANTTKAYNEIAKEVPDLMDKNTGYNSQEDVNALQQLVYKMGSQGIEVSPGVFVSPSLQDMRNAIRTADGGLFRDAKRAENAEEILKKNMKASFTTDKLKQAQESQIFRRQQAVRDIQNATK